MRKKQFFLLILLAIFLITRLPFLNSGLNVLEPDEEDYREIAQSASGGWPLYWEGEPFFYKFPLFIYLSFFLGKLCPLLLKLGPYVHLRLISVASCLGLALLFFKYIEEKTNLELAFISTLFFLLNPVLLFYSRQGTYELFFLFFGFLFFYFFEKYRAKLNYRKIIFLSLLLALAVLSKHINILLFVLPAFYFLQGLLIKKSKAKDFIWFFVLALLSSFFILLALAPLYFSSKVLFLEQFVGILGQFFIKHPKAFFAIFWEYLKFSPFWLSWPIFIGSAIGVILHLKKLNKNLSYLLVLAVGSVYINSYYLTARSFIFIVPYLMIGFTYFVDKLIKTKVGKGALLACLILTAFQAKTAFDSTRHLGLEISLEKVKQLHQETKSPIFATFEEDKLSEILRQEIFLLNKEATKSSIILTDIRKTELMLALKQPSFKEAKSTLDWVKENKKPAWIYNDPWPHFPGTIKPNEFQIYLIDN